MIDNVIEKQSGFWYRLPGNFIHCFKGYYWAWHLLAIALAFGIVKLARYPVMLYAFYIGIGVSIGIHWFTDFVAGAIIGSAISAVVGKSFRSPWTIMNGGRQHASLNGSHRFECGR